MPNDKQLAKQKISVLTQKKKILFVESCREAAKKLVGKLKQENPKLKKLLLQEEGGWHTYQKLAALNSLELIYLGMEQGKIKPGELKKHEHSILLISSMPGYAYNENTNAIKEICEKNKITLIDDCSASIGTKKPVGDYIICSLGKHKPLSTGKGGFIATNKNIEIKETIYEPEKYGLILQEINNLNGKLSHWQKIKSQMQQELAKKGFKTLNNKTGINLFIEYKNREEKEKLINYIKTKKHEYVECPKYIRTNKKAISIEIKRKTPR